MSWFGKIIGGSLGFVLGGGPIGAVLGATIGHMALDRAKQTPEKKFFEIDGRDQESTQIIYFVSLFSLMAKVARSDGAVSASEGQFLLRYLDKLSLGRETRQLAIDIFNNAKYKKESATDFATQFYSLQGHRPSLLRNLFEQLVQLASIDGYNTEKRATLDCVARSFKLDRFTVFRCYQLYGMNEGYYQYNTYRQQASDPYRVLGVDSKASDEEIKKVYRQLVRENHPDALIAKGVPPEFRVDAEKKFKEIQGAWEEIRSMRNIR